MKKLDITERERISEGFLKVDRLAIKLPKGNVIFREVLQKKDVVAIVATNAKGEIYLTKQPRAGVNDLESIEIPAGIVEAGEDFELAAKRELLEETGCSTDSPLVSLGAFTSDPACCTSITHLFLAQNVEKICEPNLDADEFLIPLKEKINTVIDWVDNGVIWDANSIIAIERAKKYIVFSK